MGDNPGINAGHARWLGDPGDQSLSESVYLSGTIERMPCLGPGLGKPAPVLSPGQAEVALRSNRPGPGLPTWETVRSTSFP